jgi:hypothetical protein
MQRSWVIFVTALTVGCGSSFEAGDGGQQDGPASDSKSGEASQDAGVDAAKDAQDGDAGTDAGSWSPDCPATLPALKGACKTEGVQCEYPVAGQQIQYDIACDLVRLCMGGEWSDGKILSPGECHLDGPNPASCPNGYAGIKNGGVCLHNGDYCMYPQGVCVCSPGLGGVMVVDAGDSWSCNPAAGCPMPRPRLGSACEPGTQCTYETCAYAQECMGGVWHGMAEPCEMPGGAGR